MEHLPGVAVGDSITLYGVGFGAVTPAIPAGQIVQQTNTLATPFHLLFGQTEAAVSYAGLAPNAVGLYQFNVVVPNVQHPIDVHAGRGLGETNAVYSSAIKPGDERGFKASYTA